jgi:hypothetical protein
MALEAPPPFLAALRVAVTEHALRDAIDEVAAAAGLRY